MGTILEELDPKNISISYRGYMPRVHEVRSPCQWLNHCDGGKCPYFERINGNFYCSKRGIP